MERQLEFLKSAAEHALSAAKSVVEHLEDGEEKTATLLKLRDAVDENAQLMKVTVVQMEALKRLVGEEIEGDEDAEQVYARLLNEEQSKANTDCRSREVVSRFERILADHRISLPPRVSKVNSQGGAVGANGSNTIIYNGYHEIEEDIKPTIIPSPST